MSASPRVPRPNPLPLPAALLAALLAASCGEAPDGEPQPAEPPPATTPSRAGVVDLLRDGQVVLGTFSGDHTAEQGAALVRTWDPDFVFYSLETGPFDMEAMAAYMGGMREGAAGRVPPPVALRIPPLRDGRERGREHALLGLENGALGLVYPHVESPEDAALGVTLTGDGVWPADSRGARFAVILVEDRAGVEKAAEIVATPGVSVVLLGPGDLSLSYQGDASAVEAAIQTVLAACKEAGVPCGITAGAGDIADRIGQGFRFLIATEPEALAVGRRAAGRS